MRRGTVLRAGYTAHLDAEAAHVDDEQVGSFEVAVYDALTMQVEQSARRVQRHAQADQRRGADLLA